MQRTDSTTKTAASPALRNSIWARPDDLGHISSRGDEVVGRASRHANSSSPLRAGSNTLPSITLIFSALPPRSNFRTTVPSRHDTTTP